MQDRTSGSIAAAWGRETGRLIGAALGATRISQLANEFFHSGKRVAIKTARSGTKSVGVTYLVLDRVDEVYAAWETTNGAFDVRSLSAGEFRASMRPTASRGPSAGRVGLVTRDQFEQQGRLVGHLQL